MGGISNIPSKVKDKLIWTLDPPTTKERVTLCCGTFWIPEAPYSPFGYVTPAHYWVTQKATSFEWGPGQEKALQQVQDAVHTALPLGPYGPADPVVLEGVRMLFGAFDRSLHTTTLSGPYLSPP